jgi:hypothetical protein
MGPWLPCLLSLLAAPLSFPRASQSALPPDLLPHGTASTPSLSLSQTDFGKRLINACLRGDYAVALAAFDSSVRDKVTPEVFAGVHAQMRALPGASADSLEEAASGESVAQRYGPIFYREYRFAHEVAKGPPGVLIHVSFPDSTSPRAVGLFIQRLAAPQGEPGKISTYRGEEKTLAGAQTWKVGGREVEVEEIVLLGFREGHMLSIKVFDDEAGALTMPAAKRKAAPIVKAAEARGWLVKAKAAEPDLLDRVAVAFLVRDGSGGFRTQLEPSEYK